MAYEGLGPATTATSQGEIVAAPFTTEVEPGRAVIAGFEDKVPLVFSLKAVRDG